MLNKNKIEIFNNPNQIGNKNRNGIEYKIPFPEPLARSIDKFINKFHTSYEKLFNYLLNSHLSYIHYEIKEDDNELLTFYYFCINDIFSEKNNLDCKISNKSEIHTRNITVKITEEFDTVIKEICEEIYYKPEVFIRKAIKCQWEHLKSDIEAGYYYIIDDFCNVPKIKRALEKVVKQSKTNKKLSKNENVKKSETKSE